MDSASALPYFLMMMLAAPARPELISGLPRAAADQMQLMYAPRSPPITFVAAPFFPSLSLVTCTSGAISTSDDSFQFSQTITAGDSWVVRIRSKIPPTPFRLV
jgi:hypothetical protein